MLIISITISKSKMRTLPTIMTDDEVNRLIAVTETPRDTVMLKLLAYTGVRVGECVGIRKQDVDIKEARILIRKETAKRSKERYQPIPKIFLKDLEGYIRLLPVESTLLFPITKARVWQIIKRYGKKAGIDKNIHPHTLRHYYATKIYEQSGDLMYVKDLLDHENIATSSIYTHLSTKAKRDKVDEVFK